VHDGDDVGPLEQRCARVGFGRAGRVLEELNRRARGLGR
jgi:hypothetical protein